MQTSFVQLEFNNDIMVLWYIREDPERVTLFPEEKKDQSNNEEHCYPLSHYKPSYYFVLFVLICTICTQVS